MKIEEVMQPERNLMLVRRESGFQGEYAGVIIPESVRGNEYAIAVVLRCGPAAPLGAGQRIVTARRAGTGLALEDGREIAIISPMDVLALLPDEKAAA